MDKKTKILIADDSVFMRQIVRQILEKAGYTDFIEAGDGKEALEKFETEKPGLVLLDIVMPEIDGMEVLKKIGKLTKVIMISAVGQDKMIEEAKSLGAVDFMTKPFDEEGVAKKIAEL